MKVSLTDNQKQKLEIQHDKARDGRIRDRIKAVLLTSEGWKTAMISQALRIHETTVLRHIKDYTLSAKLSPENGGSLSYLTLVQTQTLIEHLTEYTYHHTHQIVHYVITYFNVKYTVPGMNKWLHHNGFSYKMPKNLPHKFDETKQPISSAAYEAIKTSCRKDESILFVDVVHLTRTTKVSHGWVRTGHDK